MTIHTHVLWYHAKKSGIPLYNFNRPQLDNLVEYSFVFILLTLYNCNGPQLDNLIGYSGGMARIHNLLEKVAVNNWQLLSVGCFERHKNSNLTDIFIRFWCLLHDQFRRGNPDSDPLAHKNNAHQTGSIDIALQNRHYLFGQFSQNFFITDIISRSVSTLGSILH